MAKYQLTQEEYEALTQKLRRVRSWWGRGVVRVLGNLLILGLFALLFYLHQWLFAILLLAFILSVVIQIRRYDPLRFQHDAFKAGLINLQIFPDHFHISSGANLVQLEYSQLRALLEYPRCFVIHGHSGFSAIVPKEPLAEVEKAVLVGLQNNLPKIAKRMYVKEESGRPTAA